MCIGLNAIRRPSKDSYMPERFGLRITGTKSRLSGPNTKSFRAKLLLNRKIDV